MTSHELREKYLKFFQARGHKVIPSAPLIPEGDSSTLFIGSGMQPLVPYLLGEKHPDGTKLVNSQKSFRAEDIEEVGDNRHTTFFEMLGNWSLGDYWKKDQLAWFFEFLTNKETGVGLPADRLYVSVFAGDPENNIPRDEESPAIWQNLFETGGIPAPIVELITEEKGSEEGMQEGRIFYYGAKKNWWSRTGVPANMPVGEPGGPDSEVFYDFGTPHDPKFGKNCHPYCDCGRFLEIGNSVFMEYVKTERGFEKLKQQNVDFGGGLERLAAASNNDPDIFEVVVLKGVFDALRKNYSWDYGSVEIDQKSRMRIVADHVRAAVFMIGDGVLPSNKERGYVLRRLLRRSIFNAYKFAPGFSNLYPLVRVVTDIYNDAYPELSQQTKKIQEVFEAEEMKFMETLERGEKEIEKRIKEHNGLSGKDAFDLFQTFGYPLELTKEVAESRGYLHIGLLQGFEVELEKYKEKHRKLSQTASSGMFKGGLVDHEPQTIKHHTAHHLLLAALRQVLGSHVLQRGSNVSSERLRIDFSHPEKMTKEQLEQAEKIVNQKISENLEVKREEMPKAEAEKSGALAEFGAKYGEVVSVYSIYNKDGSVFSREFCGGPHVAHTGELGQFKIKKEEAVSAGVRRIKATTI